MRLARDRFVAFAFAAADVFLELDSARRVRYASGATQAMLGADGAALAGTPALELIAPDDRARFAVAIEAIPTETRMTPITVCLGAGTGPPVVVTGYRLPELDGCYYLALSFDRRPLAPPPPVSADRDAGTGLFVKEAFGARVAERLEAARARGDDYALTMFDLNDVAELRGRADADTVERLIAHVGATLRASSVDGDSAGRFDGETYGLLHERSLDVKALGEQIAALSRRLDSEGPGLDPRAATVEVSAEAMDPADTSKAVVYTINKFSEAHGESFSIASLSQSCEMMVHETVSQIAEFRNVVADGHFDVALQPIVDLATSEIHHYEALARFHGATEASPFALISFAEEVGVIGELDLAMARRAIEMVTSAERNGRTLSLAVNVSGRSLSSPMFTDSLLTILRDHPSIRRRLWFEITESAKVTDLEGTNRLIQNLRTAGHHVCLDDFGTGAAAFQYLRALCVDLVKIDGIYVRDALTTPRDKMFLKAMVSLCRDLGVDVVAEMVEDEQTATFLRDCGVQFAQGFLFGRPRLVIDAPAARPGVLSPPPTGAPAPRARKGAL